jgi:hypothetical protein
MPSAIPVLCRLALYGIALAVLSRCAGGLAWMGANA